MEYLFIYLLQLAEGLNVCQFFLGMAIIAGIVVIVGVGFTTDFKYEDYYEEMPAKCSKLVQRILPILIIIFSLSLFLPTKQTLILAGGTYIGKQAVKTEVAQKVVKIINLELDKHIKQLGGQG